MLDNRLRLGTTTSVNTTEDAANYCCSHGRSLTQVFACGWRVRGEPRVGNFAGLLGYVEQRNESFEVMETGGGIRWTSFTMLRDGFTRSTSRTVFGSTRLVSA